VGDMAFQKGLILAEFLRDSLPNLKILTHCGGGSFKSQFKKADKSGAEIALVLGDEEIAQSQVTLKYLRSQEPQITTEQAKLIDVLKSIFS